MPQYDAGDDYHPCRTAGGRVGFMPLDGICLGPLMKNPYRDQHAPIARMADGGLAPNWPAALVAYLLPLGAGIALFVASRVSGAASAAGCGALFGLLAHGVHDVTGYSTLRRWPLAPTLGDVAWGATVPAIWAAGVWMAVR